MKTRTETIRSIIRAHTFSPQKAAEEINKIVDEETQGLRDKQIRMNEAVDQSIDKLVTASTMLQGISHTHPSITLIHNQQVKKLDDVVESLMKARVKK